MDITKDDVGLPVYDLRYGDGEIVAFHEGSLDCPVGVLFGKVNSHRSYTTTGRDHPLNLEPSLYWSKPEIIEPPKPKKKIKREIECWADVYDTGFIATKNSHQMGAGAKIIGEVRLKGICEVDV